MKNPVKAISLAVLFFVSGLIHASGKPKEPKAAVFGVCGCISANAASKLIELSLHADLTFRYTDNSDPARKVLLSGTWTEKGNRIMLVSAGNKKSFHRKWKYNKNRQCITARYRMNFRRICLMKPC